VSIADRVIDAGPYAAGQTLPVELVRDVFKTAELNELRAELVAGRALKELLGRYEITGVGYDFHEVELWCRCGWNVEVNANTGLAELVQRADEHTEVCR
jgi:hypothetical protein